MTVTACAKKWDSISYLLMVCGELCGLRTRFIILIIIDPSWSRLGDTRSSVKIVMQAHDIDCRPVSWEYLGMYRLATTSFNFVCTLVGCIGLQLQPTWFYDVLCIGSVIFETRLKIWTPARSRKLIYLKSWTNHLQHRGRSLGPGYCAATWRFPSRSQIPSNTKWVQMASIAVCLVPNDRHNIPVGCSILQFCSCFQIFSDFFFSESPRLS